MVVCLSALLSLLLPRSYLLMALGDIAQCILLLSAVLSLRANISTTERRPKLFWILMSLGLGIWLSVQILWTYFEVFLRREVPNPFVGDVALFLHLVPMMGALAVQPHVDRNEQVKRLGAVDFVLLLVWWLYLYLFVVIPWQYVSLNESLYGRSFDLLYFVEHAVLVICTGVVWRRSTGVWRTIYKYLFGASLLYAFTSMGASIAIDFGEYYTGSFYDVPLVASTACFTAVGLLARRLALTPCVPQRRRTGTRSLGTETGHGRHPVVASPCRLGALWKPSPGKRADVSLSADSCGHAGYGRPVVGQAISPGQRTRLRQP